MKLLFLALAVLAAVSGGPASAEAAWPQFRGPGGQGVSDAKGLPLTWGEGQNVKWKTAIHGRAWSSPVILGEQIWLTTATEDGRNLYAVCLDKTSGKIVHDLKLFDVAVPQYAHPFNSYASPTPVVEPGRVYVTFGSPGTACVDTTTGKVLWERRDFVCNHFRGAGSSPLLFNNLLVLHFDGSDYQYVAALDKDTGKTLWKTDRSVDYDDLTPEGKPEADGDWRKAFSTPRLAAFAGAEPFILSLGSKAAYAYDPNTGKELWRAENRESHSGSATPVVGKDLAFLCMGLGRNQMWAVRPGGEGVINDTHVAWQSTRNVPGKPSPVLIAGLLYMVDDGGIASCLDSATGQEVWKERVKGNYSASPVYADGRIYFFSEDGTAPVIEAGREFKLLAENKLDEGFMASPAVLDGAFILRTRTHLYRIEAAE